jgi:hypothetical protein
VFCYDNQLKRLSIRSWRVSGSRYDYLATTIGLATEDECERERVILI